MPKVTIEGVVNSDVCALGEQHTVEMTDRLRGLLASRLVKVVDWHHDEPAPAKPKRSRRAKE